MKRYIKAKEEKNKEIKGYGAETTLKLSSQPHLIRLVF